MQETSVNWRLRPIYRLESNPPEAPSWVRDRFVARVTEEWERRLMGALGPIEPAPPRSWPRIRFDIS